MHCSIPDPPILAKPMRAALALALLATSLGACNDHSAAPVERRMARCRGHPCGVDLVDRGPDESAARRWAMRRRSGVVRASPSARSKCPRASSHRPSSARNIPAAEWT